MAHALQVAFVPRREPSGWFVATLPFTRACAVQVQRQNHLAAADFPNVNAFSSILESFGLDKFPAVKDKHLRTVEEALSVDIPKLVQHFSEPY